MKKFLFINAICALAVLAGCSKDEEKKDDGSGKEPVDELVLSAPRIKAAAEINTITVSWDQVENAKTYGVEYCLATADAFSAAGTTAELSYTITGLQPETAYKVRVRAIADNVTSDWSSVASVSTLADEPEEIGIKTADEFVKWINEEAVNCTAEDVVELAADIDLSGKTLTPVSEFKGTFDGKEHKLSNMAASAPLFTVNKGIVKNLVIDASCTIAFGTSGYLAILVGANEGTVSGCVNNASVTMTEDFTAASYTGLLVGASSGKVEGCVNNGDLTINMAAASGAQCIGGILGAFDTAADAVAVENCENKGKVTVKYSGKPGNSFIGGVVGSSNVHKITEITAKCGTVKGLSNSGDVYYQIGAPGSGTYTNLGGVIGYSEGDVENCVNSAKVEFDNVEGADNCTRPSVGGVAGCVCASVKGSSNSGSVALKGTFAAGTLGNAGAGASHQPLFGGVVGCIGAVNNDSSASGIDANNSLEDCFNTGDLLVSIRQKANGKTNCQIGGVAGFSGVAVKNCYTTGTVDFRPLSYKTCAGGVIGESKLNIENCYNSGEFKVDVRSDSDLVKNDSNTNKFGTQFYAGGVVGYALKGSTIKDCENKHDILFTNGWCTSILSYFGGIMGSYSGSMTMDNCVNNGAVVSDSPSAMMVGGLAGAFNGTLKNSVNNGAVTVSNGTAATGKVTEVGGFAGYANTVIIDCESNGAISNTSKGTVTGGFVGGFGANDTTWEGGSINAAITVDEPAAVGALLGWFRNSGAAGIHAGTSEKKIVIKSGTTINGAAVTAETLLGSSTNGPLDGENVTIEAGE